MTRFKFFIRISVFLGILSTQGIFIPSLLADCETNGVANTANGTAGNDTIVCDNNPAPPTQTIVAGGSNGNDVITIDSNNQTLVTGDGVAGSVSLSSVSAAGNDTITINGNTSATVYGDYMNSSVDGGDDTIIIEGRVVNVYGDYVGGTATGGDDQIIVNGEVTNAVVGDIQWIANSGSTMTGGNDSITINGTVGSVSGENLLTQGVRIGGDDEIIIAATAVVNGNVTGENNATVGGDDHITIAVGATILGTISGGNIGGDNDLLTFTGTTNDQIGYDQLQALVGCNPCSGTVTIDGFTYTFQNFEQLQNLITLVVAIPGTPGAQIVIRFNSQPDDRINWQQGDWLIPIYNHNGDTRGVLVSGIVDGLWIPETELPTGIPAENTLVGCNVSSSICLYQLAGNGYWMVDAHLVVEGRPQHASVIFDSLNPSIVTSS